MALDLFKHNEDAYRASVKMLNEKGKAAVIHPTGTGKSFIAFKLCDDNRDKTVCWLSPSEYIFKTQLENVKAVSEDFSEDNIKFYTYARLMTMTESEIEKISPDYIILDEFHRCGARMWGTGVETLLKMYSETPVLGLSATSIRYLDNQRDMADEIFDGNVASQMTLGEAIVLGILNSPKYILSVFSYKENLKKYESRIKKSGNAAVQDEAEKTIDALRRALDKAEGLDVVFDRHMEKRTSKYIVFTASYEAMTEAMNHVSEWFSKVDASPHVYSVYSDDPLSDKNFSQFKNDDDTSHLRLLFCIDSLNEGVHVDNISGVILLRPTVSPVIYKQQIGRALSAAKSTVPVIFDIVNNIENLYSIDSVREEMASVVNYYRFHGDNQMIVNEKFEITDEAADCRRLFNQLDVVLSAGWNLMFEKAREYRTVHGDLLVPARYVTEEGYALGNWLCAQRKCYFGKGTRKLTQTEIEKLEGLGIVWDNYRNLLWERYYSAAEQYYKKHGSLKISFDYVTEDGIKLGGWVQRMRAAKCEGRYGGIDSDKVSRLEKIGMIWNVVDSRWEENYLEAVKYFRKYGNLNVPGRYVTESGVRLGNWIVHLRQRKNGKADCTPLDEEQTERLNRIGMIWDVEQHRFDVGLEHAERYFSEHGNLKVSPKYVCDDGYALGAWIVQKKRQYRNNTLSEVRIESLEQAGMIWSSK